MFKEGWEGYQNQTSAKKREEEGPNFGLFVDKVIIEWPHSTCSSLNLVVVFIFSLPDDSTSYKWLIFHKLIQHKTCVV